MTRPAKSTDASIPASSQAPLCYLDANVLLPAYLRAIFLDLADSGLMRVHWGIQVLAEVRRNLLGRKFGLNSESVDRLLAQMSRAFPDALVLGSERLEATFQVKTDPKDAHVATGALALSLSLQRSVEGGREVVLVTSNMKHLPASAFVGTQVRPARPNTVLKELLAANPAVAEVLARMVSRFKAPPMSKDDLLMVLDTSNCSGLATALGQAWGLDAEDS